MSNPFDPSKTSDAFKRLNPELFPPTLSPKWVNIEVGNKAGKDAAVEEALRRIRQDRKPVLNKLEEAYHLWLLREHPGQEILKQAVRLKLCNGCWYKPDLVIPALRAAFEVKGPHAFRGGFEFLKMAAHEHRWLTFYLVWRGRDGAWKKQEILS
jgi:hypothetical protein